MKSFYYVGTYTQDILFGTGEVLRGKGEGIYYLELDHETGSLCCKNLFSTEQLSIENPSFLCLSHDRQTLYCVNELKKFGSFEGGAVTSIQLTEKEDKIPDFVSVRTLPTHGADPCHICPDPTSTCLFAANYSGGSISAYSLDSHGFVLSLLKQYHFQGHSVNPYRQEGPHLHSVVCSLDGLCIVAADLGTDQLIFYSPEEDSSEGPIKEQYRLDTPAGSGPRHSIFHPSIDCIYTTLELSSQIMTIYKDKNGVWEVKDVIDSYKKENKKGIQENLCADLHISQDGRFLYCSNRGADLISVFEISSEYGSLTHIQDIDSHGAIPRSFCLTPSGDFLLAANQGSDLITVFTIAENTGILTYEASCNVPTPVCIIPG